MSATELVLPVLFDGLLHRRSSGRLGARRKDLQDEVRSPAAFTWRSVACPLACIVCSGRSLVVSRRFAGLALRCAQKKTLRRLLSTPRLLSAGARSATWLRRAGGTDRRACGAEVSAASAESLRRGRTWADSSAGPLAPLRASPTPPLTRRLRSRGARRRCTTTCSTRRSTSRVRTAMGLGGPRGPSCCIPSVALADWSLQARRWSSRDLRSRRSAPTLLPTSRTRPSECYWSRRRRRLKPSWREGDALLSCLLSCSCCC